MKAMLLDATLIFSAIFSSMMCIVWITNKVTTWIEPTILPILEEQADDDE